VLQPRIQYAQTSDGASIAFWGVGDGAPLIQLPSIPFTHIQMEWEDPDWNAWFNAISPGYRLVRYDSRGCGLSSSAHADYSLNSMVADLEAVADRNGFERMSLIAPVQSGPVAIAFAARHPERVDRMILWCAISRGDELRTSSFEALRELSRTDWGLFAETAAHALVAGWDEARTAHRMAAIMQASASTEIHEAVMEGFLAEDISAELGAVRCPVLVAYRMAGTSPLPASARYLASAIRDASLLPVPGSSLLFVIGDAPVIATSFREFLAAGARDRGSLAGTSEFQTLLYTDIEGHTGMIQRLGDEQGRSVLREHERITRAAIDSHGGREVLARGDGFLVRFSSAQSAIECAADLQRRLADASADLPFELRVRVGINAGEPIQEGDELHGAAVMAAQAIAARAGGGEVLVANVVRELAAGKGFAFADRGEATLRGLDEPVRVWELLWAHTAT
jgi:class 3 adenylate cyclase/pimeloyl-ACP methyl ester carboxylesterase